MGDAVLDLELEGLGAGRVRLLFGMDMSKEFHVYMRSYNMSGWISTDLGGGLEGLN